MRNDIYLKEIGQRLKNIRKSKKMPLRRLSQLRNFDYGHICRLENGQTNPHLLTLKTIADVLKVDVKDFL